VKSGLFLLVAIPVVMMMVARIVGIVVMMVAMMIAVPRCSWDSAAGRDYANDA
jgi:hypothetical protein